MKAPIYLLFCLIFLSCATRSRTLVAVEHIDQHSKGVEFIDSLSNAGIDTLIGYYNGCSGCVPGTQKRFYIFWMDSGETYAKKVTNYTEYEILKINYFPFSYFYSQKEKIQSDSLIEPKFRLDHGGIESCSFRIGDWSHDFSIDGWTLGANEFSMHAAFLNAMRSELYLISSNYYWKSQNLIFEKRKY